MRLSHQKSWTKFGKMSLSQQHWNSKFKSQWINYSTTTKFPKISKYEGSKTSMNTDIPTERC